jgi:hypothetical protein
VKNNLFSSFHFGITLANRQGDDSLGVMTMAAQAMEYLQNFEDVINSEEFFSFWKQNKETHSNFRYDEHATSFIEKCYDGFHQMFEDGWFEWVDEGENFFKVTQKFVDLYNEYVEVLSSRSLR